MLHLKRLQPNQLSLHRREKSRASGTRKETRLPRSSRLYSLARSLAARLVRHSKWPAGEICFTSFEVLAWLECHKGKCAYFFPLQRGVMSFCFKVVSFSFLEVFNKREGKYEVRDPRSINPSRFYFRAHSTISKEKIVCPETRVRLENCFILVYVNQSDCVERRQSSNLNRLKGE